MSDFIVVDLRPKYERRLPKVGDVLPCFDDGKVRPSRLYNVEVVDVIPFEEGLRREFEMIDFDYDDKTGEIRYIKAPLSVAWEKAYKDTDWIYNETTDYFVIGTNGDEYEPYEVFARTKNGGWFSFPVKSYMTGGELDSDMAYFNDWNGNEWYGDAYDEEKHNFKMIDDDTEAERIH